MQDNIPDIYLLCTLRMNKKVKFWLKSRKFSNPAVWHLTKNLKHPFFRKYVDMSECNIDFLSVCVYLCVFEGRCENVYISMYQVYMHLSKCFERVNVWTRSIEHEYAFLHVRNTIVRRLKMLPFKHVWFELL